MSRAISDFGIPDGRVFTELEACVASARPDLAILCANTAGHAEYTERLAAMGVNVMVEKPFAATAGDARRMIEAMEKAGKLLAINWPLAWVESHATAKRWVDEGKIGRLTEVHSYGGNRGPALPSRRQDRGVARGSRAPEADLMVVQAGIGRRKPARLPWLRSYAGNMVHERRGPHRSDERVGRGRRS